MNLKKSFRNILGIIIASTIVYFSLDSKMQDSIKDVTLIPIRRLAYRFASQTEAGYHDIDIILDAIVLGDGDYRGSYYDYNNRDYHGGPNILKMYLGLEPITLDRSLYKPTSLTKFSDVPLYSISKYTKLDEYLNWNTDFLKRISELKEGEIISGGIIGAIHTKIDLGRGRTVSIGRDKKGAYVSLFDIWDFDYSAENCARGEKDKNILLLIERYLMDKIGKNKIGFYDRFYLNEAAIQREVDSLPPLSK